LGTGRRVRPTKEKGDLIMRKGNLNREEAIKRAGLEKVVEVEEMNCDITNRVQTDGDDSVEFAASVNFTDNEGTSRVLTAYYYQYQEDIDQSIEDFGSYDGLDWEIEGYEVD